MSVSICARTIYGKIQRKHQLPLAKVFSRYMSTVQDIKFRDLEVTLCTIGKEKPSDTKNIGFGTVFTDHMLTIPWTSVNGWGKPEIKPYGDILLSPAAKVLHYGVEGFEGMKAYYGSSDESIRMFRPTQNVKRLQRTSGRLCLPNFDGEEFLKCVMELVKVDKDWVPREENSSLYIRPNFVGTGETLGVTQPEEALLYCILSPVGPYFKTGTFNPVSLMASPEYVRSWQGGCGDSKIGGNYAPTIYIQKEAEKKNCQQVLWLYGSDQQITEVGTMNIFLFIENEYGEEELVTPPMDGLILPGVTRMSMIELAKEWDEFKVSERRYTMGDLTKAVKENRVKEVFGAGTACVICPVKDILYQDQILKIPTMENGPKIARKFYEELTGIQYGRIPSPWSVVVTHDFSVNKVPNVGRM